MPTTDPHSSELADVRGAMLAYPCDYCGALPGDWCRTISGHRAAFLHAARWWKWKRADDD